MIEVYFMSAIILIAIVCGAMSYKPPEQVVVNCNRKEVRLKPVQDKTMFNEAKDVLVSMGFSATESKKMLNDVGPCNDTDEYVRKSLESIKV